MDCQADCGQTWPVLGAAKALLAKARQWAKEQGADRLVLDVAHTATAAIALYEREGWRRTHSGIADWDPAITVHYYELACRS